METEVDNKIAAKEAEKAARVAARAAEKEAARAKKEADKEAARVARVKELEERTKAAEEEAALERERKIKIRNARTSELIEQNVSIEERREREIEKLHSFYDAKLDKYGELKIKFSIYKIITLLQKHGFYRYDQPNGGHEYVRIENGKIQLVKDKKTFVDFFAAYLRKLPERELNLSMDTNDGQAIITKKIFPELLSEKLYDNIGFYFSDTTLPRLVPTELSDIHEISTIHDTKNSKFIFYNNVALHITASGTTEIEYEDLSDYIESLGEENGLYLWENSIIDRDYYRLNYGSWGEFGRFALYICGGANSDNSHVKDRLRALMSILGYLLHDNFETNLKCALFTDATQANGKPSGGTGKGILGKALSYMLNRTDGDSKFINVNGKDFDPNNERRYSEGDITTQLVHIEDAVKTLDFEQLFFDVTEGATFRKMYQDKTKHRIKLMISTNTPFDLSAPSVKRRVSLFELDNFFNADRTPQDIFDHRFFESEWDEYEWNRFDNFMVSCCELYMKEGLIKAEMVGYKKNLINANLKQEFIAWFENYINEALMDTTGKEYRYSLKHMWDKFVFKYPDSFRTRNGFSESCKFWLVTMDIKSGILRSTDDMLIINPMRETKINTWFVQ